MRDRARALRVALAAVLSATVAVAQAEDPLDRFEVGKTGPGWDGIELGMSLVKAERLLGATLAISSGERRPVCSEYAAEVDFNGQRLVLGFPSARPGAKIDSIWVRFEGEQIAASRGRLVEALRSRAPGMVWIPDPEHPEAIEQDDPTPVYQLVGSPASVVKLTPREGIQIARRECLSRSSA